VAKGVETTKVKKRTNFEKGGAYSS